MASETRNSLKFKIKYKCLNSESRKNGLMHKPPLEIDGCCFFKFPYPDYHHFWNKNVDFDINVVFIDANLNIINIATLEANQTTPVGSNEPVVYVVEVLSKNFEKIIDFHKVILQDNYIEFINNNCKSNFSENSGFQKIANTVYKTVR